MTFDDVKRIRQNPTAEDCDNEELSKMIDIALEKQIPKKPKKIIKSEVGIKYNCPNCDKTFMRIDINNVQWGHISKFCEICGQALDWSGNNAN